MTTRDLDTMATGTAPDRLLRIALAADAVASGAMGVLLLAAGGPLGELLGAPRSLSAPVGAFLIGYAALLVAIGTRRRISRGAVWTVIVGNAGWVIASVVLTLAGPYPLTGAGTAFVLVQAAAVAALAELQFVGLRRLA
ncbi:hypothetical protein [Catellatospora sp. NPDC049609]|uniref:hypothetical protein n=1 Tax=Catellatospora sp. NPDC049609 TaxID=3155505 RepID=UPI003427EA4E